jgi:hypothetical protein
MGRLDKKKINKAIGKREKINGTLFLANLPSRGSNAAKKNPESTAIIIDAG